MTGKERSRRFRERHPDRVRASNRVSNRKYAPIRYARKRAFLDAAKNVPCADCKKTYPPYVMHFDHVRGKKLFTIGTQLASRAWSVLRHEITKCDVVCANCHAERTWGSH